MFSPFTLVTLLSLCSAAVATVFTSPSQINNPEYDFVIVGGGTAGSVLANRLSENPAVRVLVIESGADSETVLGSQVPFMAASLRASIHDWNFTSVAQPGLASRELFYSRGHILGGSSSTNVMAYQRGSDDLYNKWAKLTGDQGWSWPQVKKYYEKSSAMVAPADRHDISDQHIPSAWGKGPVHVSLPGFKTPLDEMVIKAAKSGSLGPRFAYQKDYSAGNTIGFSYVTAAIGESRRSSSSRAHLRTNRERKNLDILLHTRALKLIHSATVNSQPEFKVVEVAASKTSPRFQFKARKEMILSAGVFSTPALMMLSGLGPRKVLESVGIAPLTEIPELGTRLVDHPMVPHYYSINTPSIFSTFDSLLQDKLVFAANLLQWQLNGTGRMVVSPANTMSFMRLPENSSIFKTVADPSSGPKSAHTELLFTNGFAPLSNIPLPTSGRYLSVLTAVVSSTGNGTVTINSNDPWAKPVIDPKLYETPFDRAAMLQATKDARAFIAHPQFASLRLRPYGELANVNTDAEIANYIAQHSVTINHPVATARMSPKGASYGVVDPDLMVKRVLGLRIVDASVFPSIPEVHTQGPTYIVAERAADLIKAKWNL